MKVRDGAVPGDRGGGSSWRPGQILGGSAPGRQGRGQGQGSVPAAPASCAPACGSGRGALPALCPARRPPEEKATAAARSVSPVRPPGTGMAGERSLAHQGARQPVSLIPWSLCRRDGDRLDSASLKELRDGVWPGSGRRQDNCSRSCSSGIRADHA